MQIHEPAWLSPAPLLTKIADKSVNQGKKHCPSIPLILALPCLVATMPPLWQGRDTEARLLDPLRLRLVGANIGEQRPIADRPRTGHFEIPGAVAWISLGPSKSAMPSQLDVQCYSCMQLR